MKILLTGVTGYVGKRLLPQLVAQGHHVVCCVRDVKRISLPDDIRPKVSLIEVDFLIPETLKNIPIDIDAAYYLIHSMSGSTTNFEENEKISASNFTQYMNTTSVLQVIYLSGIVNQNELSKHLSSRKAVEDILASGKFSLTTLRACIVIGSGSASFEIMRDLVEKLPVMIAPRWLNTRSQPISIRNTLEFLLGVLFNKACYNQSFDIGGKEILTYKEMLLKFAKVRKLKRRIYVVPVMTPRLSSYWLYFITSTNYKLAVNLVDSMKIDVICKPNNLAEMLHINLMGYEEAIALAFMKTEQQEVVSSWKDALSTKVLEDGIQAHIEVPVYGCFRDVKQHIYTNEAQTLHRIWSIGGQTGWYYGNWMWKIRGMMDKMVGGVGLRRGRRNQHELQAGDSLDFWRVLYVNKQEKRLLLFAEMKLPGEAWLEFRMENGILHQVATFRPLGLAGRLYWYSMAPLHFFIFRKMIQRIAV